MAVLPFPEFDLVYPENNLGFVSPEGTHHRFSGVAVW